MCEQMEVLFSYSTPQPEMSNPLRITTRQLHLQRNNKHCTILNAIHSRRKKELNPLRPERVTEINATVIGPEPSLPSLTTICTFNSQAGI
jgi:hypothetical protein